MILPSTRGHRFKHSSGFDGGRLALTLRHPDPVRHGAQMNASGFADGSVGIPLLAHVKGDGAFSRCSKGLRLRASLVIGKSADFALLYCRINIYRRAYDWCESPAWRQAYQGFRKSQWPLQ